MTPSRTYHATRTKEPPKILRGLDKWLHGLTRWWPTRPGTLAGLKRTAREIQQLAAPLRDRSDEQLDEALAAYRLGYRSRPDVALDASADLLPALAAVTEAARRTLGLAAHDNQLMAALAMMRGYLVEMDTGEGKSLAIALGAVIPAWSGRPFHVLTANDYLAERDAGEFEAFYARCGVSCGSVTGTLEPPQRREGYTRDIVYTTPKELAADYLRDRLTDETADHPGRGLVRKLRHGLAAPPSGKVLRGLHRIYVDEADNALIDEAVTPLIIAQSRDNPILVAATLQARQLADVLEEGRDYQVNFRRRDIRITASGFHRLEAATANLPGIWQASARRVELVKKGLEARFFFLHDQHYVIEEEKVIIVDESTGRQMPGRTWQQGLHQAVEAKEGLPVTSPAETMASISFQRFFRLFYHLAGTTGTAREAAAEMWSIYRIPVIRIPRHRPCQRREHPWQVHETREEKWSGVVAGVLGSLAGGGAVLVGTRSVRDSEHLAGLLEEAGYPCRVLNAVRHREEAEIIAAAGTPGQVTIATNMAGRGTDIKLAGGLAECGGLHVIATEFNESGRVDRQLFGRAGRQGDPGRVDAHASLDDELPRRVLSKGVRRLLAVARAGRLPGWQALGRRALKCCQRKAEKDAFRQREQVLKADEEKVRSLGFAGK